MKDYCFLEYLVLFLCLDLLREVSSQSSLRQAIQEGFRVGKQFSEDLRDAEENQVRRLGRSARINVTTPFTRIADFLGNSVFLKTVGNAAITQETALKFALRRITTPNRRPSKASQPQRLLTRLFEAAQGAQAAQAGRAGLRPCPGTRKLEDNPLPRTRRVDCCPLPNIECDFSRRYRTYDGSCNCLSEPNMGRSNRAHRRMLPPDYADGISEPRVARNGGPLPSARSVSLEICDKNGANTPSSLITAMFISMGQVIDHDITRTPISKLLGPGGELVDITCGASMCETTPIENMECFPIQMPPDEPFFTDRDCLKFVRSQAFLPDGCPPGPREQANSITSWIDSSFLYGSSEEENENLRNPTDRALMRVQQHPFTPACGPLLPTQPVSNCQGVAGSIQCFLAGDGRVNEQIALASLHTIFVRLHNYIARNLRNINPFWNNERVFQESRRLVTAIWQNIIYNEYLPLLLGPAAMNRYRLYSRTLGCINDYSCFDNAGQITNVFATAAYRFSHSQVPESWTLVNSALTDSVDVNLANTFFRPRLVYQSPFGPSTCGINAILLGQSLQLADRTDRLFSDSLRNHLFTLNPAFGRGHDLPASNIQRGRDHGIPGYNEWRQDCGLPRASNFNDLIDIPPNVRQRFAALYDHVDDIDLFAAAMSERQVPGGLVGPTFACLIGRQFHELKYGDRFWFENCGSRNSGRPDNVPRYNKAQIENIKKYSSGRMLCDTLTRVRRVKKFTMMKTRKQAYKGPGQSVRDAYHKIQAYGGYDNVARECRFHPGINFNLFKETPPNKKSKKKCYNYKC